MFMKCFSLKGWLRPYGAPTARRRRRGGETGCGEGHSHQALVAIITMSIFVISMSIFVIIYFIFISFKCMTNIVYNIIINITIIIFRYMTSGSGSHRHSQVVSWDPRLS